MSSDEPMHADRSRFRCGFRSQSVLLPGDDPAEYQLLLDELSREYPARDLTGLRCVREMADAEWRLRRARLHQEIILTSKIEELAPIHPDASPALLQALATQALTKELAVCLRHESKFERQYDRAYRTWTARKRNEPTAIKRSRVKELPFEANRTPRNAPCPCGSGAKHKRCCGKNAPAVLFPEAPAA